MGCYGNFGRDFSVTRNQQIKPQLSCGFRCLLPVQSGEISVMGHPAGSAAAKSAIGVSPQETAVAGNLTVRENLELTARIHGFSPAEARRAAEEQIAALSLNENAGRRAKKLSGGWQRRLSIAMALVSQPKILFLDEPTLGLDVIARSELWDIIRALKGRVTVILTTHYMEEAEALADRIAIMKDGKLLLCDTPAAIKAATGEASIEKAFLKIVKEGRK